MRRKMVPPMAILGIVLATSGIASAAITHYWSFDPANDDASNNPTDLAGGYTAVITGGANPPTRSSGANGVANSAVFIDNGNSYSACGFRTQLKTITAEPGAPFSFEAMFRYTGDANGAWNYLTDRNNGGSGNCPFTLIQYKPNQRLCVYIGSTAVWWTGTGPVWNFQDGSWYDVAVTYDGTTVNLYLTPYSETATPILAASTNVAGLSAIGTQGLGFGGCDGSKYGVKGYFDWAAIWNVALTSDQIERHIRNDSIDEPFINNANGATDIAPKSATMNGNLMCAGNTSTYVYVYWGTVDGQDTNENWANTNCLGIRTAGPVSTNIDWLAIDTTYYYRYWASNAYGTAWASPSTNFRTLGATPKGTIITVR